MEKPKSTLSHQALQNFNILKKIMTSNYIFVLSLQNSACIPPHNETDYDKLIILISLQITTARKYFEHMDANLWG